MKADAYEGEESMGDHSAGRSLDARLLAPRACVSLADHGQRLAEQTDVFDVQIRVSADRPQAAIPGQRLPNRRLRSGRGQSWSENGKLPGTGGCQSQCVLQYHYASRDGSGDPCALVLPAPAV